MFNRRTDVDVTEHVIRPWRIVAFVVASGSLALGIWALARTGLDLDHLFRPERRVLGLPHTPALALGEIAFGVVMVLAATSPIVGRLLMIVAGAAVAIGGVLVVTDTFERRIDRWTAANDTSGWLFIVVGALVVLAAAMLPTLASRDRTVTRDDHRGRGDRDDALFWRHRRDART
jgi:hypothetical protein